MFHFSLGELHTFQIFTHGALHFYVALNTVKHHS